MASTSVAPLSARAKVARLVFWNSWAMVPLIVLLDETGAVDASSGPWYGLRVLVGAAWALAGMMWAVAEYRRRHRSMGARSFGR